MQITLQFPAEEAAKDSEKERVWSSGPNKGTFFNSYFFESHPATKEDGSYDFTQSYVQAIVELGQIEPRFSAGKHLHCTIIA